MQPAVGENPRHITLHMGSLADAKRALSRTSNKTKTSLFRLFKQTPEFEVGKDSSLAAVWVKLYKLPLHYFNEASLFKLGSLLGTVLRIHPVSWRSRNNDMQSCIEMDVSKPFTKILWIGTSKEYGWEVSVEYEGNQVIVIIVVFSDIQSVCVARRDRFKGNKQMRRYKRNNRS